MHPDQEKMSPLPCTEGLSPAQSPTLPVTPAPVRNPRSGFGGRLLALGLGLALVAGLNAWFFLLRPDPRQSQAQPLNTDKALPSPYFRNWGKPDLALVVSGEMWSFLQPCGCSEPQYGGLARRYQFLKSLKDKGWAVEAVDLGDIGSEKSGPQTMLKYEKAMKALNLMGYAAVGLGKHEMLMPLSDAIGQYAIDNAKPALLGANLNNPGKNPILDPIKPWHIADKSSPRLGIIGLVGPSVAESVKKIDQVKFGDNSLILNQVLSEFAIKKVELALLLYQGSEAEAAKCAAYCAQQHKLNTKLPRIHLMMCHSAEEEPPGKMDRIGGGKDNTGETFLIRIGHKGRKVGVVGVFKQPGGQIDLKYELIHLGPEWETPKGQEKDNPIIKLMEDYAKQLQRENYLAKFPRSQHEIQRFAANNMKAEAKYIGSEKCGECHGHAYKVWEGSRHSHAYDTLVTKPERPTLRQFDGECIVCHTVGFQHDTGYFDKNNNDKQNKKLHHVGCETCHGPGSIHANNPRIPALNALMNPYKPSAKELNPQVPMTERLAALKQRLLKIDTSCMKCHDQENDVKWIQHHFLEKWVGANIMHPTPAKEAADLGMKLSGPRIEMPEYQKVISEKKTP